MICLVLCLLLWSRLPLLAAQHKRRALPVYCTVLSNPPAQVLFCYFFQGITKNGMMGELNICSGLRLSFRYRAGRKYIQKAQKLMQIQSNLARIVACPGNGKHANKTKGIQRSKPSVDGTISDNWKTEWRSECLMQPKYSVSYYS